MRRRRSPRFFPVSLPGSIVHHIPVKSRSGYAEARSDFGYRYIGRFEQSAYGFDLFSRELWRTAAPCVRGRERLSSQPLFSRG
jgi:hypothetical protein